MDVQTGTPTTPQPSVKPKLRMPHPSIAAAKQFREEWAKDHPEGGAPQQQAAQPEPQPQPAPEPQPAPQPAPAPHVPEPSAGNVQYANTSSFSIPDSYYMPQGYDAKYSTLEQERNNLRAEVEQLKKQLETSNQSLSRARELEDEQFIDKYLDDNQANFTSISRDDAKLLLTPVYKSFKNSMDKRADEAEARIRAVEEEMNKRMAAIREKEQLELRRRTRDELLKVHPDLAEFQKTDAYCKAMLSPIGPGAAITLGQVVGVEFERGNAAYINDVLTRIKQEAQQQTGSLESVASVSSQASTTTQPAAAQSPGYTLEDLDRLKQDVQTGRMSRAAFREAMHKYRGATASQNQ